MTANMPRFAFTRSQRHLSPKQMLSPARSILLFSGGGTFLAAAALFVNGVASFPPTSKHLTTRQCIFDSRPKHYNINANDKPFSQLCQTTTTILLSSFLADGGDSAGSQARGPQFRRYDKIQVEVVRFGKLGASVEVIGLGHAEEDCIGEKEPALGRGLILQREIQYFRSSRGGLDVIVGEVLPAYVERVRDDGRLDISLRDPGGKGKADAIGAAIMSRLQAADDGTLDVGDKSTPDEINKQFPGTSKVAFKKAVAALYKKGLVQPGKHSISLMSKNLKHD